MNYWPACPANLSECQTPLIEYIRTLVKPGECTAKAYYGPDTRGWTTSVSVGNTMALTGYAGEHAYELWEGIGQIKSTSGSFLRYTADSSGGMSGGAIYLTIQMKAAGFNHGGYPGESYNYGVKINSSIANEMNYYKNKN